MKFRSSLSLVLALSILGGTIHPAVAQITEDDGLARREPTTVVVIGVVGAVVGIVWAVDYISRDNFVVATVSEQCAPTSPVMTWVRKDSGIFYTSTSIDLGVDTPGAVPCGSAFANAFADDGTFSEDVTSVFSICSPGGPGTKTGAYAKATADEKSKITKSGLGAPLPRNAAGDEMIPFERTLGIAESRMPANTPMRGRSQAKATLVHHFEYEDGHIHDVPGLDLTVDLDPRGELSTEGFPTGLVEVDPISGDVIIPAHTVTDVIMVPRFSPGGAELSGVTESSEAESGSSSGAGGPWIDVDHASAFQSAYPQSGLANWSENLTELAIRTDAAIDVAGPEAAWIERQDQMVVEIFPSTPQAEIVGPAPGAPRLTYCLETNPLFDDFRQLPPGLEYLGIDENGRGRYIGFVDGEALGNDRYAFDLPEPELGRRVGQGGLLHPGDEIRYTIEAIDSAGNASIVPESGDYISGEGHDRRFSFQGLPSLQTTSWGIVQPQLLIVQALDREDDTALRHGLREIGLVEGIDYDVYRVFDPDGGHNNSIGASFAGGATLEQLMGYSAIMVVGGEHGEGVLGDGSMTEGNGKTDDIGLLRDYVQGGGALAVMGGQVLRSLASQGPQALAFLQDEMGVEVLTDQEAPSAGDVRTTGYYPFQTDFIAHEREDFAWPLSHGFDEDLALQPIGLGNLTHEIVAPMGETAGAQVVVENDGVRLASLFDPSEIHSPAMGRDARSMRGLVLEEILEFINVTPFDLPTDVPSGARIGFSLDTPTPNPFNPRTSISFRVDVRSDVLAQVFDVRGRRVDTLLDGTVETGTHTLQWNGTSAQGAPVASGMYFLRVAAGDRVETRKMVLAK